MTINEMLLLDVGSEDEKIEYYKKKLEEERERNPPPKIEVMPEDLDPTLRFKRMLSESDDPQSNFRSSLEVPREQLQNDLEMFEEDEAGGIGYYQSYNRNDLDPLENTGYIGSNPGGFQTMKGSESRHNIFSKPSSPSGRGFMVGERATTVHNESVYYDGGRESMGTNT